MWLRQTVELAIVGHDYQPIVAPLWRGRNCSSQRND
jgi:hypothetical protein